MKKVFLSILIIALSLQLKASMFLLLAGPFQNELNSYRAYFETHYNCKIFYSGQTIDEFEPVYKTMLDNSKPGDTIIQVWAGHGGLTKYGNRGGGCFDLSVASMDSVPEENRIFCIDAMQLMSNYLSKVYKVRLVIILLNCRAGLLCNNFPINDRITVMTCCSDNQLSFSIGRVPNSYNWFTLLFLKNINKIKDSSELIEFINNGYLDKTLYFTLTIPTEAEKYFGKAIDYYPLKALHIGPNFNFK
jgi:hypothetical protein